MPNLWSLSLLCLLFSSVSGVVECMAAGTPGSQVRLPQTGHRGSLRGWTDWLPGRQWGELRHRHGDHPDPVVGGTMKIRRDTRRSVHRFSNHEFDSSFLSSMEPLMGTQQRWRKTNHSHLRLKPHPSAALTGLIGWINLNVGTLMVYRSFAGFINK